MIDIRQDLRTCWNCDAYVNKKMDVRFSKDRVVRINACYECSCPRSFADLIVMEQYEKETGKEIYAQAVSLASMRLGMEENNAPTC